MALQLSPQKRRDEIKTIQDEFKRTRQLSEKKVALSLQTYETVGSESLHLHRAWQND